MPNDPKECIAQAAQISPPPDVPTEGFGNLALDWLNWVVELENTQALLIGLAQLR
jgi:hypothetical protein